MTIDPYDWLADWLFRERYQTRKSMISHVPEITDQSLSHADRIGMFLALLLTTSIPAAYVIRVYHHFTTISPNWSTIGLAIVGGLMLPFVLVVAAGWTLTVRYVLRRPSCTRCGRQTRYYHTLSIRTQSEPITDHETYRFCTPDCREAWEREHMSYEREEYYTIQTETDEMHMHAEAHREIMS